ncbi:MAG: asparagine synthase (glutamine-hydrolyzing) [Actinomycetia bacterium]|nr:asparagine synthase (glutamine-hydrolyzing) [Actinomycetes bacterium]
MSGFVGFVNRSADENDNRRVIEAMANRIAHRGPDQEGYDVGERVSLGFRGLALSDPADSSQPIRSDDGTLVLVMDGEIYNGDQLREELAAAGHPCATRSDAEVVLRGYEADGAGIVPRLRGDFAFVLWDAKSGTVFGARDVFGAKPMFYYHADGQFLVASEIKAFLAHPGFDKRFNRDRLPDYLSFEYVPTQETLFRDVFKVPPASTFTYRDGTLTITPYDAYRYAIDEAKTLEEWEEAIASTFQASFEAHWRTDVEVGGFLSSGIDSSYVVSEAAKRTRIRTFSVGYSEEKFSELSDAAEFAAHLGVENIAKTISSEEYFAAVPAVQYHMDEPLSNPSAVAVYYLAQLAASHVKVVLSGEGADELFGGYPFYQEPLAFSAYLKVPQPVRTIVARVAAHLPVGLHGRRFLVNGALPIEQRSIRNNYVFSLADRAAVLASPITAPVPAARVKPYYDEAAGQDEVSKMQYVDLKTWLVQDMLVKADRMCAAHSLAARCPILDREMLRLALQIPTRFRVTREQTKVAFRGAAARQVPARNAERPKLGFPVPLMDWLREDRYYQQVRDAFTSEEAREFFDQAFLLKLLDDHRAGHAKNMRKIWSVYCFLVWYRRYFVEEQPAA